MGSVAPGDFLRPALNHRLTDLGGALGVAQMERLDEILAARARRGAELTEALARSAPGLMPQATVEGALANYQTFGLLLPEGHDAETRDAFIGDLRAQGVQAGRLSYSLSQIPALASYRAAPGTATPTADAIAARGFCVPLFPQMTDEDATRVAQALATLYPRLAPPAG